ncbi:MAG: hypothetical protein IJO55_03735 [Lachnospiraceae bacterium]|nr:hypothetical protein [Lachnospiraceae bacterium]
MKSRIPLTILLASFLISMLIFSVETTTGAKYGLLLWYQSVVPALFPFMVISSLITSSGGISYLMAPVYIILKHLLPLSKEGCYVLVSGLICGFPMGAKVCADFIRENRITLNEGNFLMAICNQPSPMFLLGFVYPFFREHVSSSHLLIVLYLPLILLALTARHIYFSESTKIPTNPDFSVDQNLIPLDDAIMNATKLLCKIGGYLILFSILIQIIKNMTWIPETVRLMMIGILEMTTAVRELAVCIPFPYSFIFTLSALAFGGLSGLFQVQSVLQNEYSEEIAHEKRVGLSIRPYVFWKLAHAAFTAFCAYILCNYAS